MADSGTEYTIDLPVTGVEGVAGAASSLDNLASRMMLAGRATSQAAEAMRAGEAAYKQAESNADRAAKAVEKLGIAAQSASGAKLENLLARQAEAAAKAQAATAAMNAEAVSLDKLKAAAGSAAEAEAKLAKSFDSAKAASKAAAGSGDVGAAAGALGKLGGPLGSVGQKAFDAADAFKKMSQSLGSAGPYVAIAVGIAAIVAASVAAALAVGAATAAILKFAIGNSDAARTTKLLEEQAKGGAAGMAATAKLALSLDNQAKKLKASIGRIFSLNIEPFLEGISKLVGLFDENTASAKAIEVVFKSLFQPLLDGIVAFIPKAVSAFIQFEILVLKALIAIKPFGSTILEVAKWFGILAAVIGGALAAVVIVLVAGVAAMAVGFGVLVALVAGLIAGFVYLGSVFADIGGAIYTGIGAAFDWLKTSAQSAIDWLAGLSLSEIGTALIDGLIAGITGAGGGVLSAITGIASGAVNAAKSLLGISSPSKVFAEIGMQTGAGMAGGVEAASGDVQGSLESMVAPPTVGAGGGAAGGSSGSASVSGNTFNFHGVAGMDDAEARFGALMTRLLEGDVAQIGGSGA
jgi:hypothetical protein